ncbi:hypothetical protein LCGC14_1971410 [marine sediment metagenome]|uniref:Uncharacterized protein n=1 Tax=marine sediment metagenome TaxID=412755 RepID=A0A0F9FBT0_9ZZZZ
MFLQAFDIEKYMPFIIAAALLGVGVLLLKIGLAITKAESKTNMKWVAGSFFIQYGVTLFIGAPILLEMVLDPLWRTTNYIPKSNLMIIAPVVILVSFFVTVNLINMLHKPGIVRSVVITLIVLGPIIASDYIMFLKMGTLF